MYRDYKVRLKMSMFRPIKQEDYIDVYENPYAMITYVALRIMGKDDMICKNEFAMIFTFVVFV